MKTRMTIADNNGYIFENGKLHAYEFVSAIINFENETIDYTCKIGGKETRFTASDCPTIYASVGDYHQDSPIEPTTISWASCIRMAIGFYVPDRMNDSGKCELFYVEENEVLTCNAPMGDYLYNGRWNIALMDDTQYFKTRAEALLACDTSYVDANGNEVFVPSAAKRVALNEEQTLAVEAVRQALMRAKELNVSFITDSDGGDLYAYSNKEIATLTFDTEEDVTTKYGVLVNSFLTKAGLTLESFCKCDVGMYAQFK